MIFSLCSVFVCPLLSVCLFVFPQPGRNGDGCFGGLAAGGANGGTSATHPGGGGDEELVDVEGDGPAEDYDWSTGRGLGRGGVRPLQPPVHGKCPPHWDRGRIPPPRDRGRIQFNTNFELL